MPKRIRESEPKPLGAWKSTCLALTRDSERGVLQIDDETHTVAGCGVMPSVIGMAKDVAIQRLRERGWKTKAPN